MRRSNRSGADLVVQVDNVSKSEVRVSGNKSTLRPLEDKGHDSQVVGTGNACVDIGVVIAGHAQNKGNLAVHIPINLYSMIVTILGVEIGNF